MYNIIIVIIIIILLILKNQLGPLNKTNNKGYGTREDDVSVLLDRIEWSIERNTKIFWNLRYLFWVIIISLIACVILENFPPFYSFIQLCFVLWLVLISLHNYFHYHSDKFTDYAITDNVKRIRQKLKIKKNKDISIRTEKFKSGDNVWNFNYNI